MKILCVSDYVDPMIYNQNLAENFSDIDLVLAAGDLPLDYVDYIVTVLNKPTYFIFGNHNLKDLQYYHKNVRNSPGMSPVDYNDTSHGHGGIYLGFKTITDYSLTYTNPKTGKPTPLLLAGVSGSLKYNNGLCQYTDFQMKLKLLKLAPKLLMNKIKYGRYLDIFLTHASPRHIHDHEDSCHKGFDCFNKFIEKYSPALFVHGHIHLYDMREERITRVNNTSVINAYAHCVIEYPSQSNENSVIKPDEEI